ncbi:hypothetical protein CK203_034628 [Vitis vinifera]|uniref:Retrotransposon gag domain-containing protein n=1 Tax=Vitis vinifera TaxID=29760 RepID=A0A438HWL2_VITVI|nr:hypothetical protein CK203_034628 [Vitis vinifera]
MLHGQSEVAPPSIAHTIVSKDVHALMDRLKQQIRHIKMLDSLVAWDDSDGIPVASLPVEFRMSEIDKYIGIGYPRIHIRLYSTIMRAYGLDESQLIVLFPLSLSGVTQHWRELDALRQGFDESVSSFISRWREKFVLVIDRPTKREQIRMVCKGRSCESLILGKPENSTLTLIEGGVS